MTQIFEYAGQRLYAGRVGQDVEKRGGKWSDGIPRFKTQILWGLSGFIAHYNILPYWQSWPHDTGLVGLQRCVTLSLSTPTAERYCFPPALVRTVYDSFLGFNLNEFRIWFSPKRILTISLFWVNNTWPLSSPVLTYCLLDSRD